MGTLSFGPFVISSTLALTGVAGLVALAVGKRLGPRKNANIQADLFKLLVVGVFAARLAFVIAFFDVYRHSPWSIVDLSDGGFYVSVGVLAALALAATLSLGDRNRFGALAMSLLAASGVWLVGTVIMLVEAPVSIGLPPTVLTTLEGRPATLDALSGKPMVVNLWATWCPPCRREMPVLADAQARNPDIAFAFVNQGETEPTINNFIDAQDLKIENVLLDASGSIGRYSGSDALPTTLFFDAHGKLSDHRVGGLSAASLAAHLEAMREGQTPAM